MKRLRTLLPLLILPAALLLHACKKNTGNSGPPETVLSKVYRNGELYQEYQYNAQKKLSRYILHSINRVTDLAYNNDGSLKSIEETDAPGNIFRKHLYHYDAAGYLDTVELYVAPEIPIPGVDFIHTSTLVYEYNDQGQITKENWTDPEKGDLLAYYDYTYNNNGSLKKIEYWKIKTSPELFKVWDFGKSDSIPSYALKIKLSPVDIGVAYFNATTIHTTTYTAGLVSNEHEEKLKNRNYDNTGFLTDQVLERNFIKPANPTDEVVLVYQKISI